MPLTNSVFAVLAVLMAVQVYFLSGLQGGITAVRSDMASLATELRTEMAGLNSTVGGLSAQVGHLSTWMVNLNSTVEGLSAQVAEVAGALVLPRVRRELEACADTLALFLVATLLGKPVARCTDMPMPQELLEQAPRAVNSTRHYFLTSAHCFFNSTLAWVQKADSAFLLFEHKTYTCSLVSSLSSDSAGNVLDLAVIACAGPISAAPSAFSQLLDAAHEPVAMAGFSVGKHLDINKHGRISGDDGTISARHVRMTHLCSSIQLPEAPQDMRKSSTVVLVSGSSSPPADSSSSFGMALGYLEHKPEQGMSGGPVLDVRCRLVGIIKEQSLHGQGGTYVRMGEPRVQRWVVEALSKDSSSEKAVVLGILGEANSSVS
jgi:hypothetical protein